jgi:hypothetical protein
MTEKEKMINLMKNVSNFRIHKEIYNKIYEIIYEMKRFKIGNCNLDWYFDRKYYYKYHIIVYKDDKEIIKLVGDSLESVADKWELFLDFLK